MTTALILFVIILFCSLLLADFSWSNVLSTNRNEVVFAGRNHDYGAYRIRQEHHRVMVLAMVFGFGGIGALTVLPSVLGTTTYSMVPPFRSAVVEFETPPFDPPSGVVPPTPPPPVPPVPPSGGPSPDVPVDAVDSLPAARPDTSGLVSGPGNGTGIDTSGAPGPPVLPAGGGGGVLPPTGIPPGKVADKQPRYPGGETALYADLDDLIIYPEIAIDGQEEGTVLVGFIVDSDGSITDVKVVRGRSPALDREAVRVVKRLKRWEPGQYDGQPVPVRFHLPIKFELAGN